MLNLSQHLRLRKSYVNVKFALRNVTLRYVYVTLRKRCLRFTLCILPLFSFSRVRTYNSPDIGNPPFIWFQSPSYKFRFVP